MVLCVARTFLSANDAAMEQPAVQSYKKELVFLSQVKNKITMLSSKPANNNVCGSVNSVFPVRTIMDLTVYIAL